MALALGWAGCAGRPPPAAVPIDFTTLQTFLAPEALLPFRAEGSAQFNFRGKSESGSLRVEAAPGPKFRIQMLVPVTGSVGLEIRLDPRGVLLVDYMNERYYRGENTPANRRHLFRMDLSVEEFQLLLTGRVNAATFREGDGTIISNEAVFRSGGSTHRLRLDEHRLPREWVRENGGFVELRAEFPRYQELDGGEGPSLRVPRLVRLFKGEGGPALVLGIRRFFPGQGGDLPGPDELPAGSEDFSNPPLPDS